MNNDEPITADFIVGILRAMHPPSEWIFASEVQTSTGAGSGFTIPSSFLSDRRIDAFAMNLWPSKNYRRVAYEIKVARSDFLDELHHPEKRARAVFLCNEFWFAVAPGVYNPREDFKFFHNGEGVMEISLDHRIKKIMGARAHQAWPMPVDFTAAFLRCVRDENQFSKTQEIIYDESPSVDYTEPSTGI